MRDTKSLILIATVCVALGLAFGAVRAYLMDAAAYDGLSESLSAHLYGTGLVDVDKTGAFMECVLKYGKIPVIVWFLAFIPPGWLVSFFLLFVKGASLGFTMAIFTRISGLSGLIPASVLILPQNLILLPAYCYAAMSCAVFSSYFSGSVKLFPTKRKHSFGGGAIRRPIEYAMPLIICMSCVVLAALAEAYLVPKIAGSIIP